jgi:hypothetical protein
LFVVIEPPTFALATSLAQADKNAFSGHKDNSDDPFSSETPLKVCVALYAYKGVPEDGEMDLQASETILILDSSSDTGWWRGRRQNGEEGFFPSNFVKVLS